MRKSYLIRNIVHLVLLVLLSTLAFAFTKHELACGSIKYGMAIEIIFVVSAITVTVLVIHFTESLTKCLARHITARKNKRAFPIARIWRRTKK